MYSRSPGTRFHCMLHQPYSTRRIHLHFQGKFLHLSDRLSGTFCAAHPNGNSLFPFQMVALNFDLILLMLKDTGSIPRDTLHSQDGLNLGDIRFCPLRWSSTCNASPSTPCAPSSPRARSCPLYPRGPLN